MEEVTGADIEDVIITILIMDRDNKTKDQTPISIDKEVDKVHNNGVIGPLTITQTGEDQIINIHKPRV